VLLRITRRGSLVEVDDPGLFCDTLFQRVDGAGLDLSVSAYRLAEVGDATRAYAEHAAHADMDPPKSRTHFDLQGITPDPTHDPLQACCFAFLSAAHHEIHFADETAVRTMADALFAARSKRGHHVARSSVREYVKARLETTDAEWEAYCATRSKGQMWRAFAG